MPDPRFLQIHTLTSYTGALLNRDDSGLAKRLTYGGALRTRVSSQCLKRHWRTAEDPHALHAIDGAEAAFRSRDLVTKLVLGSLEPEDVAKAIEPAFQKAVYGDKATTKQGRQTLLFGNREIAWLRAEAERLVREAAGDPKAAATAATQWGKDFKKNIAAMREGVALPGGLTAALFGRMVTSDTSANITAPVHVAHAFTVHAEESESDYFTAVDDLSEDEPGADTIQETELTSGLFYGYVVVDLPCLMENLGPAAVDLAGAVLHNLVHLIAEVSPGAKLGSTAPYGRASLMLLEAGDRQPRSLAEAFRTPCDPDMAAATDALKKHLCALDRAYATGEARRMLSLSDAVFDGAEAGTLKEIADWAAALPGRLV
ncbi:type I-E CRISPR-associated protein Cas7/Cse4/CasC [Jannaschia pagri]|uniref:Type I-E CRISPR-associated protein Cas7/Cse4/CasC n=1 Tax=Jannaschia pagri TaxID=2829797 RepID=A0ABQ4NRQ8_9RHOB|nr:MULTISPECIES: type I-E CRISPR-associated protein Cas7/Cse4/CasC [unclassified Jannaschia]GIT93244.1 type I-E CRISPR-associated protein Cas7/Cse4/CasC [Jannaschia sp. AI_61]GIT97089.1 type I-E CRISPR-associated protein Cas7/Cse4/CasC [Jannaschia sp. AI_62]